MRLTVPAEPFETLTPVPSLASRMTALLARVSPARKLMLLDSGKLVASAGYNVKKPSALGPVTVRFTESERALAGTPHLVAVATTRVSPAASGGAPASG